MKQLRAEVLLDEVDGSNEDSMVFKKPIGKGPMDSFCRNTLKGSIGKGKEVQTTINTKWKTKKREKAIDYIAAWFYEAEIPHNAVTLDSIDLMLEAIRQFGPRLKKPSAYYELGTPLNIQVSKIEELLKPQKESWSLNGCSIMTNAWVDRHGRVFKTAPNCSLYMNTREGKFIMGLQFLWLRECMPKAESDEFNFLDSCQIAYQVVVALVGRRGVLVEEHEDHVRLVLLCRIVEGIVAGRVGEL